MITKFDKTGIRLIAVTKLTKSNDEVMSMILKELNSTISSGQGSFVIWFSLYKLRVLSFGRGVIEAKTFSDKTKPSKNKNEKLLI